MTELIASIIFLGSAAGLGTIIFRKAPLLSHLPEISQREGESLVIRLKKRIKEINFIKNFSLEVFFQKILTKIRILAMKVENKTLDLLKKLRQRTIEKKASKDDNYWQEIKKSTEEKEV